GLTVVISKPTINNAFTDPRRSPIFADRGDTVAIEINSAALGTECDTLKLFLNNELITQVADTILNYDFITADHDYGMNNFIAIGIDTIRQGDTVDFAIMVNQPVTFASRPESVIGGVNLVGDSGVIFSLQAPYKDFVYLIGDFNDWMVDSNYYMKCEDNGGAEVHWWLAVEGLDPQTEYAFQYFVDGEIRIADPYSEKILDPWNDAYIPASVYPDLKTYPAGKTSEIVGTFQIEKPEHTWQTTDYTRPEKTNLIIYEMLIRDFVATHDYKTLIDTLDYLQNLGVNAIELMPINEFEGNSSWGYNPSFYFAPDKYYGPAYDLKEFVDSCHARGIAVIQDIVLNHSFGSSPLVRLYDHGDHTTSPENPWYNEQHNFTNPDAQWGYDFDHESPATQVFVDRVTRYWVTEYKIDGYRFDFTKGIGNNIKSSSDSWGSIYDSDRIRLLKRMADALWEVDSTAYVILEHLAENSEEKELADYGMMLWGNMNWNYAQSAMGYTDDSDFSWGFYKNRSWSKPGLITYMESHDEERLMYKNLTYGNSSGSYSIKTLSTALERMKMTAAFFLTLPGPKMIWQFGELGYDFSIDYNGRLEEKPIRWDYLQDPNRLRLYKTFQALIKLRMENDVFSSAGTSLSMTLSDNVKRIAMTGSMNVVIIGNFGVTATTTNPSFQHGGVWYDYFSGESMTATGSDTLTLVPGEFHIFTDQRLETPEAGLLGIKESVTDAIPKQFKIYPNYPNPFNSSTTFEYDLEKTSAVQLRIFDLLGREIFSEKFGNQSPGKYLFVWNCLDKAGIEARSGIYFILLQRGNERQILKMTLLK
ncbi:MAG: alpha-amylase family glycosyl hydrolase, partial [Candidatus Marinimicrobia bacterium]|nr:alpha-amylase family glycosyl hydrolase [Candidatus Neomarinimicrobiota bacterium]